MGKKWTGKSSTVILFQLQLILQDNIIVEIAFFHYTGLPLKNSRKSRIDALAAAI